MSRDIDLIKEKLSIIDIVSSYIKLDKKGRYFKAKCPFHNENTASFTVTPERDMFHCFGCGKGGDIFVFVQEMESMSFPEALVFLANKAGVTLSKQDKPESHEKTKIYEALEMATKFYEVGLRKDKDVVAYLLERGMSKETMVNFRVGFSGTAWDALYQLLKKKGFSDDILKKAGLVTQGKKGYVDWFRDRIMFPISDTQGRVVGFTGRIFLHPDERDNPPEHKRKTGKYVNSPETIVFGKSKILFGYDKAKRMIMKEDMCLVMEGQMDVIMAHQAGTNYSVGLSGTALSIDQIRLMRRFTDRVIYALDPDNAGREALRKSALLAYKENMTVSVLALPEHEDPADYIRIHGAEAWKEKLQQAQDYIEFETSNLSHELTSHRDRMHKIAQVIFPVLFVIDSSIAQDIALQSIAHETRYAIEAIRSDFKKYIQEHTQETKVPQKKISQPTQSVRIRPVEQLLKEILGIMWWQEKKKTLPDCAIYQNKLTDIIASLHYATVDPKVFEDKRDTLVFGADMRYDGLAEDKLATEVHGLLSELHCALLREERRYVMRAMEKAEQTGNESESLQCLQEYQKLSHHIDEVRISRS